MSDVHAYLQRFLARKVPEPSCAALYVLPERLRERRFRSLAEKPLVARIHELLAYDARTGIARFSGTVDYFTIRDGLHVHLKREYSPRERQRHAEAENFYEAPEGFFDHIDPQLEGLLDPPPRSVPDL